MYAVDPLWKSYQKAKLCEIPTGVETICSNAETFKLPHLSDLIISVNALDHSGSLENSIVNIMSNLKVGGLFCMHIHMRTKEQLNKGHQMLITEPEIDKVFYHWDVITKSIYPRCPIENKPYRSYVVTARKAL